MAAAGSCLIYCRRSACRSWRLRQPIEFVAPQLGFHPIQRFLLCQTARVAPADSPLWLAVPLVFHLFVSHINLFRQAMRSMISSAFTSSLARSCWRHAAPTSPDSPLADPHPAAPVNAPCAPAAHPFAIPPAILEPENRATLPAGQSLFRAAGLFDGDPLVLRLSRILVFNSSSVAASLIFRKIVVQLGQFLGLMPVPRR